MKAFVAQTSVRDTLSSSYAGMLASSAPCHVGHGTNSSVQNVLVTPTAANNATFTLTITQNGAAYSFPYTSSGTATATEISNGLAALVNASQALGVTATGGATLTLLADSASPEFAFSVVTAASAGNLVQSQVTAHGAQIPDGSFVVFSSETAVRVPNAAGDITGGVKGAGVSLVDFATTRSANASVSPDVLAFARKGQVYVQVEETVTDNSAVYVRYAAGGNGPGAFGASAGSSERALLESAVYRRGAAAGGIAIVELNLV